MLIKTIKLLVCVITAGFAFNAQAVLMAELDENSYEWLENSKTAGANHLRVESRLTNEKTTLYEYEYTSRELEQDLSHAYAPWYGLTEWNDGDSTVRNTRITTSDSGNVNSSPSVKVLLLIVSGLIGVIGITKDRSEL